MIREATWRAVWGAFLVLAIWTPAASAQEPASAAAPEATSAEEAAVEETFGEITVTAKKREESIYERGSA